MYEFIDRPVTSLGRGRRFLIWSMRRWTLAMHGGHCAAPAIAPAFAQWGMIRALRPFARLMIVLNRDALETIAVCNLQCNHVSEHEALLIALVRDVNGPDRCRVRDTLEMVIEDDSVGEMLALLSAISQAMQEASLTTG